MMTRDVGADPTVYTVKTAPPPLHVYDAAAEQANYYPAPRPQLMTQPIGPRYIFQIPTSTFGDDPTDPSQQTKPRIATIGMFGRLHQQYGGGK